MRLSLSLACATLLATGAAAHADTLTFSFGTAASLYSGSGILTTGTLLAPGEFPITALTGTVSAAGTATTISSLLTAGTFPTPANGGFFPANDNVVFFFPGTNGTFSQNGVSFLLSNGTQINLYTSGAGGGIFVLPQTGPTVSGTTPITIRAAATAVTPEPSSFLLLATGIASALFLRRLTLN